MTNPEDILAFWLDEQGPEGWYAGGAELDQEMRDRFECVYNRACEGALSLWLTHATGTLAYIILLDQFSRNMFRDTPKAFASDGLALIMTRMPETGGINLLHAKAHREVVRKFGRFPNRNAALSRLTPVAEAVFLEQGGYGATVEAMKAAEAA